MEDLDKASLEDLNEAIKSYYPDADFGLVERAYRFSEARHKGQKRKSGEDYIVHPLSVAKILATMKMDIPSIVTGILHDTVEDTPATLEELRKEFGQEIAFLVDGVTKISQISFSTSHEKQAENFRKMVFAMARDIRVIFVKLADRTHNMRTLSHMKPEKQQKIAQETIEIYAPLANRLGISWMKIELEDLSFKYLKPDVYKKISQLVNKKKGERDEYIQNLIDIFTEKVSQYGLDVEVSGRAKHFYSIFKKMDTQQINFEDIHDIVAFRVLTKKMSECYEVLGIVHSFFKPVPGRFKDYIAMPKNNMYQSLHTTVIGPYGERLEIQIRTTEMHQVAELGIAAHWEYKSGKLSEKDSAKFHWLRKLAENQEAAESPSEYLESLKLDLFMSDIYVFSPKGQIYELPSGSTPLDFAYTVHTEVGNKCIGSKVNGRIVPLKHKLRSGDTVEIMTSPTARPNKDWLKFVRTSRAKSKIRTLIRSEERERARDLGHEILERECKRIAESIKDIEKRKDLSDITGKLSFASYDEMLISIGYGKASVDKILTFIFPNSKPLAEPIEEKKKKLPTPRPNSSRQRSLVKIRGLEDEVLVRFGKCCNPLPGEEIVGYISRGKGVTIHKLDCKKVLDLDPNRSIDVIWDLGESARATMVRIKVFLDDSPGILNLMSQVISSRGINIKSANIRARNDRKATGLFELEVRDKSQLNECIRELERLDAVISVDRVQN
ncbi:MAG: bifunctional (p)ppGpp synthetase/guanosine-3',5'-bis(diphosphate) 3'-pyrophosphohydrolase [Bdellovibrionota bacterium]